MPKPAKPTRRQRRHGDLPSGYQWRDGRPRWIPSPSRRAAGWRATDLKDAHGRWLAEGAAIQRARAIADAVRAWAAGEAVPPAVAAMAPQGAAFAGRSTAAASPRAIRVLLDEFYEANTRPLGARRTGLSPKTQADYKSKIARFLTEVRGKIAEERFMAMDVDILLPPGPGEAGDDVLTLAYEALRGEAGESMASGCVAAVSAWMGWMVKRRRIWATNPCAAVERSTPEGRIVVYDWPEVVALVRRAEARGLHSVADAIVLAVDLSWAQQDLLAMTWGQVHAVAGRTRIKHRRIKTGQAGNPPLLPLGLARLEAIRARLAADRIIPAPALPLLICELTGKSWVADTFRHIFAEIRAEVACQHLVAELLARLAGAPGAPTDEGIASKQFRDLRDTAITYCYEAGLDIPEICSRTLHAPTRAQAVIEKHYGAIGKGIADRAAAKLEAYFAAEGYHIENGSGQA